MRSLRLTTILPVAALALAGCYAEVADDTVSITRACTGDGSNCTFAGAPTELQTLTPIPLSSGSPELSFDLGGQDFLQSEKTVGPLTLKGNLSVNDVVVQARDSVSLAGITRMQLTQVAFAGCTPTNCNPTVIASYDVAQDGPGADPTRVVLKGSGANLLSLGNPVTVHLEAAGRPPAASWKADVTIDGKLNARATF